MDPVCLPDQTASKHSRTPLFLSTICPPDHQTWSPDHRWSISNPFTQNWSFGCVLSAWRTWCRHAGGDRGRKRPALLRVETPFSRGVFSHTPSPTSTYASSSLSRLLEQHLEITAQFVCAFFRCLCYLCAASSQALLQISSMVHILFIYLMTCLAAWWQLASSDAW